MSTKRSTIEWQVCEDEHDWQIAQALLVENCVPVVPQRRWSLQRVLRWGVPLLLFVLLVGVVVVRWISYKAQAGLDEIETELQAAMVAEAWSASATTSSRKAEQNGFAPQAVGREQFMPSLLRIPTDAELGTAVTEIEVRDVSENWAVIEVLTRPSTPGPTYRQTRVYEYNHRLAEFGWERAEVTAAHWGNARQLESNYFVFHYYALDQEAVIQAALKLDTLYPALYGSFFTGAPTGEKAVVMVDPEWEPREARPQSTPPGAMVVASPAATLAPIELAISDLLMQSVMLALFDTFAEKATDQYHLPPRWLPLRDGMVLWLIWDQELSLSIWRQPLVKWVFWDTQSVVTHKAPEVPEFTHELCAHHLLWMRKPLFDVGVPVACPLQYANERLLVAWHYREPLVEMPLPPLIDTSMYLHDPKEWSMLQPPVGVALATILEYAATTFGTERIPVLLAALSQHKRWDTLIPAVFGLSLEEFESGWRAFLEEQYGIKP